LLAADAQHPGYSRGRQLAGAHLEDPLGSLLGLALHLLDFCRLRRAGGNLVYLFQPAGEPNQIHRALLLLQQGLQARAQGFALGQVDPVLQGLEHAFHRPALPVVEGDPVDVELAADLHRFAAFGPDRQHRLDFVLGTVRLGGRALFLFRFVVGRGCGFG
jgi:hypothetical protein